MNQINNGNLIFILIDDLRLTNWNSGNLVYNITWDFISKHKKIHEHIILF